MLSYNQNYTTHAQSDVNLCKIKYTITNFMPVLAFAKLHNKAIVSPTRESRLKLIETDQRAFESITFSIQESNRNFASFLSNGDYIEYDLKYYRVVYIHNKKEYGIVEYITIEDTNPVVKSKDSNKIIRSAFALCTVLKNELPVLDNNILLWNSNYVFPNINELLVVVKHNVSELIGNNSKDTYIPITNDIKEKSFTLYKDIFEINFYSRNSDAIAALNKFSFSLVSNYSKQKQKEFRVNFGQHSSSLQNIPTTEGGASINHYQATLNIIRSERQEGDVEDYFDTVNVENILY